MPNVKLSSKYQITLPMEIVRALKLKAGDRLVLELIDDHIVLMPEPENWVKYFSGRLKGTWGDSVEEIDKYIAEERASYERDQWLSEFDTLCRDNADVRKVVDVLLSASRHGATLKEFLKTLSEKPVERGLQKLLEHGAVREKAYKTTKGETVYYLVPDFVRRLSNRVETAS